MKVIWNVLSVTAIALLSASFLPDIAIAQDTPSTSEVKTQTTESEPEKPKSRFTPEEIVELIEADRLYLSGDLATATKLYRQVKKPFKAEIDPETKKNTKPIYDSAELNKAPAVYWRIYNEGLEQKLKSKILAPLRLLVEKYPEFIPGHLHYAQALKNYQENEQARLVLQQALTLYPNETELVKAKIEADGENKEWLEASLSARQFVMLNPNHPQAQEFIELADNNLKRYQRDLKERMTTNAIGNVITGALGYAFTGSLFGPFSAIETTALLLRGESGVGDRLSNRIQKELPMLQDEEVLQYVEAIGNKLASVAGRKEFNYKFYVIMDDRLNAFALPGGKVFINAGAILKTDSEAELAGLLAHELSHSVLSHSFQMVMSGNLTANMTQFIPYVGGLAADLLVLNYSRDMERQADVFGTRMLANAGYAADGVRNLMITLEKEDLPHPPAWLSTHPDTKERVSYLESLIVSNNFNRYAYEGVSRHGEIKQKVAQLWEDYQKTDEYRRRHPEKRK